MCFPPNTVVEIRFVLLYQVEQFQETVKWGRGRDMVYGMNMDEHMLSWFAGRFQRHEHYKSIKSKFKYTQCT